MLIFLKLYLAHLIADFILQPNWIAKNKRRTSRLLLHSFIHLVTAVALINKDLTSNIVAVLVVLALTHALCDFVKATLTQDKWLAFTVDQIIHLVIIILASIWLTADASNNGRIIFYALASS